MSAQREGVCPGGMCLPRGISAQGGVCLGDVILEGGCLPGTPPVNRITDRCRNITLPQLR